MNTMKVAVDGLIAALDKTPRINWEQTALMALQAVKDLGYSEGYRVGSMKVEIPEATAPQMSAGGDGHAMPTLSQGEDKALSDSKPSPEEAMEDLGHQFFREMARQIGVLAVKHDLTPGSVEVALEITPDPNRLGQRARVSINLKNPTTL